MLDDWTVAWPIRSNRADSLLRRKRKQTDDRCYFSSFFLISELLFLEPVAGNYSDGIQVRIGCLSDINSELRLSGVSKVQ